MNVEELFEGISNVVYHGTSIENAAAILNRNEFRLTPEMLDRKANNRKNGDYVFFLSTARTKQSEYTGKTEVIFRLDGRKLSQNYSGASVDFFGDKMTFDESEDRVYSMKPTIPFAMKYITGVDMYSMFGSFNSTEEFILKTARKLGIPVRVFDSETDMASNQRPWSEDRLKDELYSDSIHQSPSNEFKDDRPEKLADEIVKLINGRLILDNTSVLRQTVIRGTFEKLITDFMRSGSSSNRQEIMSFMRRNGIRGFRSLEQVIGQKMREQDSY